MGNSKFFMRHSKNRCTRNETLGPDHAIRGMCCGTSTSICNSLLESFFQRHTPAAAERDVTSGVTFFMTLSVSFEGLRSH